MPTKKRPPINMLESTDGTTGVLSAQRSEQTANGLPWRITPTRSTTLVPILEASDIGGVRPEQPVPMPPILPLGLNFTSVSASNTTKSLTASPTTTTTGEFPSLVPSYFLSYVSS